MDLTLEDFDKCCRWCLRKAARLEPIYDACLGDMFLTITGLKIEKDDCYPQQACKWCITKLSAAFNFRQTALRSHETLGDILKASLSIVKSEDERTELVETLNKTENQQDQDMFLNNSADSIVASTEQTNTLHKFINCTDQEVKTVQDEDCKTEETFPSFNEMLNDAKPSLEANHDDYLERKAQEILKRRIEAMKIRHGEVPERKIDADGSVRNVLRCQQINCKTCMQSSDLQERSVKSTGKVRCKVCYRMVFKCNLETHVVVHREDLSRPFACHMCQRSFATKFGLDVHLRLHRKKKRFYLCEQCGASFKRDSSLRRHMDYHTGRNLRICDVCGKKFVRRHALIDHLRSHSNEKPYSCDICNSAFTQVSSLRKHQRLIHAADGLYRCVWCEETFHHRDTLKNHKKSAHGRYKCYSCKLSFVELASLRAHNGDIHPNAKRQTRSAKAHLTERCGVEVKETEEVAVQCWCSACGQGLQTIEEMQDHSVRCTAAVQTVLQGNMLCPPVSNDSQHLQEHYNKTSAAPTLTYNTGGQTNVVVYSETRLFSDASI